MNRKKTTEETTEKLLQENQELRHRLEQADLKIESDEIMGDIWQESYGINLLKKSAAKQSVSRLKERHTGVSLQALCGLFGYTRQAYYKHLKNNAKHCLEEEIVLERIHSYRKWMPR
ncbi:hypothetical protein EZS27_040055, partial [termite gut metagenome]